MAFLVLTYTKYSSMMLLNKLAYPVSELLLGISLWHHLLYVMTLLLVTSKETLQCFLDMTEDYSGNHRYCYQARKSAVLPVYYSNRVKPKEDPYPWTICSELLLVVEKTTHLCIVRAKSQTVKRNSLTKDLKVKKDLI